MSEFSDIECRIFLASGAVGCRLSKCALDPGPHACGVGPARCVGRGIRWPRASRMRRRRKRESRVEPGARRFFYAESMGSPWCSPRDHPYEVVTGGNVAGLHMLDMGHAVFS